MSSSARGKTCIVSFWNKAPRRYIRHAQPPHRAVRRAAHAMPHYHYTYLSRPCCGAVPCGAALRCAVLRCAALCVPSEAWQAAALCWRVA
eukprot:6193415-Pleurochrysis_carterae.AAC.4